MAHFLPVRGFDRAPTLPPSAPTRLQTLCTDLRKNSTEKRCPIDIVSGMGLQIVWGKDRIYAMMGRTSLVLSPKTNRLSPPSLSSLRSLGCVCTVIPQPC